MENQFASMRRAQVASTPTGLAATTSTSSLGGYLPLLVGGAFGWWVGGRSHRVLGTIGGMGAGYVGGKLFDAITSGS